MPKKHPPAGQYFVVFHRLSLSCHATLLRRRQLNCAVRMGALRQSLTTDATGLAGAPMSDTKRLSTLYEENSWLVLTW